MEKKSKEYVSPNICVATMSDEIMEVVPYTDKPSDPSAKKGLFYEEEENYSEDIWSVEETPIIQEVPYSEEQ